MAVRSLRCSFCGRPDSQVEKLVAGPRRFFARVYICDRCATLTIQIMDASSGDNEPRGRTPSFFRQALNRLWPRDSATLMASMAPEIRATSRRSCPEGGGFPQVTLRLGDRTS